MAKKQTKSKKFIKKNYIPISIVGLLIMVGVFIGVGQYLDNKTKPIEAASSTIIDAYSVNSTGTVNTSATSLTYVGNTTPSTIELSILKDINIERAKVGVPALSADGGLTTVARRHSADMINRDYFSHTTPGGTTAAQRMSLVCGAGYMGEVLQWGTQSYTAPAAVVHSWMSSATHRSIILSKDFRFVGVGRASGTYKGTTNVAMVTADLCTRVK